MKTIITVTICVGVLILVIPLSVALTNSVFEQQTRQQGRYQLIFGQIQHTMSSPSNEPDIILQKKSVEPICFKFDTVTGEIWRYESDFYKDPNNPDKTRSFDGFVFVGY